jgi:3-hydroxyacyl-CoA dehydrogenase
MRWGFNREAGPFETWDSLGTAETAQAMKAAGFPPAAWVEKMLAAGNQAFYQYDGEIKISVFNPSLGQYVRIERPPSMIMLPRLKAAGKILKKNPSASIFDFGDGVIGVELHTKMNAFDTDMFEMITHGLDLVERGLRRHGDRR